MYFLDIFILATKMNIWFTLFFLDPMKNDEEVYLQLQNIQQYITKCVEVSYEHMLK